MGALEKIAFAEEKVAELQTQLGTVESVLEKAEEVVITGEKAGRFLSRTVKVLLAVSIIAVIALVVRKVRGGCNVGPESEVITYEPATEAEIEDEVDEVETTEIAGGDEVEVETVTADDDEVEVETVIAGGDEVEVETVTADGEAD